MSEQKRKVTETEMLDHIQAWPRPITPDRLMTFEPPLVTFNDFTLGRWPECVVASCTMSESDRPSGNFTIHRELP
jgi:hypothetical protein